MSNPSKASESFRLKLDSRLQFAVFVLFYISFVIFSFLAEYFGLPPQYEQKIAIGVLMTAFVFIIRKCLVIEHQSIPALKKEIIEMNIDERAFLIDELKKFAEQIEAKIPLSNVEYIADGDAWHHKAIAIIYGYKSKPVSVTDREGIFAVATYFDSEKGNSIPEMRRKYFEEIAVICCNNSGKRVCYNLIVIGRGDSLSFDVQERIRPFDKLDWAGLEMQIKKAMITGIDLLLAGDEILFSVRTVQGAHPVRKGIYIKDKSTSTLFHRWFNSTFNDPRICSEISSEDAELWGLTEEQKEKLNVKTREAEALELCPEAAE